MTKTTEPKEVTALRAALAHAKTTEAKRCDFGALQTKIAELEESIALAPNDAEAFKLAKALEQARGEQTVRQLQRERIETEIGTAWADVRKQLNPALESVCAITAPICERARQASLRLVRATLDRNAIVAMEDPVNVGARMLETSVARTAQAARVSFSLPEQSWQPSVQQPGEIQEAAERLDAVIAQIPAALAEVLRLEEAADAVESILN